MHMHVEGAGAACTDAFEPTNDAREAQAYQQNMASPRIGRDSWMKSEHSMGLQAGHMFVGRVSPQRRQGFIIAEMKSTLSEHIPVGLQSRFFSVPRFHMLLFIQIQSSGVIHRNWLLRQQRLSALR